MNSDVLVVVVVFCLIFFFFWFSESVIFWLVIAEAMFSKKATFLHVFINCLSVPTCILCHVYNLV